MKPRKERGGLIVVTGIVLLAACSDAPTAPSAPTVATPSTPILAASVLSSSSVGDTIVQLVSVDPTKKTAVNFGASSANKVSFTANSICDLATSSYGADQWDQPCAPQATTVVLTIKSWYDADGHPHSDFQPHMRFNPAADPVVLTMKDRNGVQPNLGIVYCADISGACVDESVADPSLVTYRDPVSGNYYRRVKHFSGYNISTGNSIDGATSLMAE
ncbi:MAG TPA: hypothetical protein VFJ74_00915 [Gemmatimonadaceae bacterium]|nr:hypothetical protein [Gemmatimonadaceae bacterium]